MAAYAMVELEITNPEGMAPYLELVQGTVEAHGGRYLVRAGETEVAEGGIGEFPLKVILEFPSMESAKGWYESEEYRAILPYRTENSKGNFVWVEGV
jgi:uncharacterized protein (DUF1330 family)